MISRSIMSASNKVAGGEIEYEEYTEVRTSGFVVWPVPEGVTQILKVVTIGAGGKGGNGNGVGAIPAGGGGGGKSTVYNITVTADQYLVCRVPAANATTTACFGPSATSPFVAASSGTAANVGTAGVGGTGIVGDEFETGNNGGTGNNSNHGGNSPEATGGLGAMYNSQTFQYSTPGVGGAPGGGGGGGRPGSTSYQGGNGGRGEVRITYLRPVV